MKVRRNRNWMWGILMLLAAAFIVLTQLGLFVELGLRSVVAAVLAVMLLVSCITQRSLTMLPFVIALAYIVLRNQALVPHVSTWAVLLAAALVCAGMSLLFPQRSSRGKVVIGGFFSDGEDDDWDEYNKGGRRERARTKMGGIDNNPIINVNFGSVSRYIHADQLETVQLSCNFGGMEIYLDQAELSPSGATVHLDCKFGGIDLFVPRHWQVDEQISCILGGVDINSRMATPTENAPQLTVTGSVMFGGVDIRYI